MSLEESSLMSSQALGEAQFEVMLEVIRRHRVAPKRLALESGLSVSQVNRILAGQYAVTVDVLRAAWRLTRDQELVDLAFGTESCTVVPTGVLVPGVSDSEAIHRRVVMVLHALHRPHVSDVELRSALFDAAGELIAAAQRVRDLGVASIRDTRDSPASAPLLEGTA